MIAILTPYLAYQRIEEHCADTARAAEARGIGRWYKCPNDMALLARVRNEMIDAVADSYPYILFLDSDVGVPVDAIDKAVRAGRPVVGIGYPVDGQGGLCAGMWDKAHPGNAKRELAAAHGPEFEWADWVGMGATLIETAALKKLERPYFRYEWVDTPDGRVQTGEDLGFCANCQKHEVPIALMRTEGSVHARVKVYSGYTPNSEGSREMPEEKTDLKALAGGIAAEINGVQRVAKDYVKLAAKHNETLDEMRKLHGENESLRKALEVDE